MTTTLFATLLLAATASAALAQGPVPAPTAPGTEPPAPAAPPVLLVIDIQNFYFAGGRVELSDPVPASLKAKRLLEHFRAKGWPVVHVQHLPKGQAEPSPDTGDEQYRIHANVVPGRGETVIGKHHASSFRDTGLLATLQRLGAKRLVIAGMQTHMCVEAATRHAADLGFEVTVARDACATRALRFGDVEVPAAHVHASTLATISGSYGRALSTDEVLAELK